MIQLKKEIFQMKMIDCKIYVFRIQLFELYLCQGGGGSRLVLELLYIINISREIHNTLVLKGPRRGPWEPLSPNKGSGEHPSRRRGSWGKLNERPQSKEGSIRGPQSKESESEPGLNPISESEPSPLTNMDNPVFWIFPRPEVPLMSS